MSRVGAVRNSTFFRFLVAVLLVAVCWAAIAVVVLALWGIGWAAAHGWWALLPLLVGLSGIIFTIKKGWWRP